MYTMEEGVVAVRMARNVLERHVMGEEPHTYEFPDSFSKKAGAFVTLQTFPDGMLRGCIGYPYPIFTLGETIVRSARSAATSDPRFHPVSGTELKKLTVEVSLLSPPIELSTKKRRELPKMVKIGRDGLMVEKGSSKGLLLPQVAVEWGWTSQEFLEETCMKARLPATMWAGEGVKVFRFTADVFHELAPGGEIKKVELLD